MSSRGAESRFIAAFWSERQGAALRRARRDVLCTNAEIGYKQKPQKVFVQF
jgi:hypothetical protein